MQPSGPQEATLKFDVAPDRASVFVDDLYIGRAGDYAKKAYGISPGEHLVKIELHGHEMFEEKISLISAQSFELKIRLAKLSEKSKVTTPSVLDRLIDQEPRRRSESLPTPAKSAQAVKDALRRDLELLMNTRRVTDELPEAYKELRRSAYAYGLSDITSMTLSTIPDQQRLLREIEACLALFEPRLVRTKVAVRTSSDAAHLVHFSIEGLLRLDPEPVPIVFDTFLELNSGTYQIRGEAGA